MNVCVIVDQRTGEQNAAFCIGQTVKRHGKRFCAAVSLDEQGGDIRRTACNGLPDVAQKEVVAHVKQVLVGRILKP